MIEYDEKEALAAETAPSDGGENTRFAEQSDWGMASALAEEAEVQSGVMSVNGQPVDVPMAAVMTPMIYGLFSILAPNWGVTEGESKALSQSWADVIEHYFPDASMSTGLAVIVTAVGTTGAVVGTRIMQGIPRTVEEGRQ